MEPMNNPPKNAVMRKSSPCERGAGEIFRVQLLIPLNEKIRAGIRLLAKLAKRFEACAHLSLNIEMNVKPYIAPTWKPESKKATPKNGLNACFYWCR